MKAPVTSKPLSFKIAAETEESTPPETPTSTLFAITLTFKKCYNIKKICNSKSFVWNLKILQSQKVGKK